MWTSPSLTPVLILFILAVKQIEGRIEYWANYMLRSIIFSSFTKNDIKEFMGKHHLIDNWDFLKTRVLTKVGFVSVLTSSCKVCNTVGSEHSMQCQESHCEK